MNAIVLFKKLAIMDRCQIVGILELSKLFCYISHMDYRVDVNCDMGESFGVYALGIDQEVIKYITSSNIACGFHASDPDVMARTVELCKKSQYSGPVG